MKLLKLLSTYFLMTLLALPANAQSTADPVIPGLLVTSGCPSGVSSCFKQYSSTNPLPVTVSTSSSGASTYSNYAATNTLYAVKAAAGSVTSYTFQNPNATAVYVQFFDLATGSVTLGTTTPKISIWVPANGAWDSEQATPITFTTAITVAVTTTATGSTAPTSPIIISPIGYQ